MKKLIVIALIVVLFVSCIKKPTVKPSISEIEKYQNVLDQGKDYYLTGKFDRAMVYFKRIINESPDRRQRGIAYYYTARIFEKRGGLDSAFIYYASALKSGLDTKSKIVNISKKANPIFIEQNINILTKELQPEVLYLLGEDYNKLNDKDNAERLFKKLIRKFPDSEYGMKAKTFIFEKKKFDVAILLPLTGEYKEIGEAVREGIEIGAKKGMVLHIYDTKANPANTFKITKSLIKGKGKFAGIVGPLLSINAIISAVLSSYKGLPLVTPTATSSVIDSIGRGIYTINKNLQLEGYALADYAINTLGMNTAGILFPESEYGRRLSDSFSREFKAKGGSVLIKIPFAEGETNFKVKLSKIKETNCQVLFIPGTEQELVDLIPQLKYYGVKSQILGSDGWKSQQILKEVGEGYMEGVVFADVIFNDNEAFREAFQSRFGQDPNRYSALGYDSINLLYYLLVNNIPPKDKVKLELISGSISVKEDVKKVPLYIVSNGKFIRLR